MKTVATFVVNGLPHEVAVEPHELLIEVLRDHLVTGTKHSCGGTAEPAVLGRAPKAGLPH